MKKKDLILGAGIIVIALAMLLVMQLTRGEEGNQIRVTLDGKIYGTYSLSKDQTIEVKDGDFYNRIRIEDGKAYMEEANCPDGYCDEQPADDGYYDEQPAGDDGYYDEQPEGDYDDPNYATDGEEGYYDEAYYEDEPAYKTNVFLAILYTLGAIVIGVPVLAVLLVLDLAVLAIGVACGAGGVGLIATAFIGLPMVADMLILLGGGAAVIAIALVVIWLAIWLFIRMVIGWVRLLVRLGKRWCRKEIAA